jgi:signal transduction histidine kinase
LPAASRILIPLANLHRVRRRDLFYAWLQRHPVVPDAALAVALFVLLTLPFAFGYDPGWPHVVLGGVMFGALVFRRVRPVESFAAVTLAGLVQWIADVSLSPIDAAVLLALYSIAAYGPRWASRLGLAVGLLGAVLASQRYALVGGSGAFVTGVMLYAAAAAGAWALGDVRGVRQAYVTQLLDRARQAERERDQRAQIATAEERARIAREMHDVVAHNLSVIVVQADGGRFAAKGDPQSAVSALETIAETGRGALAEMRRLLGILRTDEPADVAPGPQPDLARLPELVAAVRGSGLPVDLRITGEPRTLAGGQSLAAYRAVQEALTNVLKHAGPQAQATVELVYSDVGLTIEVTDDGRGASATTDGDGHGLAGMRERLTMYGGRVAAGPNSGGGWRVTIELPYQNGE